MDSSGNGTHKTRVITDCAEKHSIFDIYRQNSDIIHTLVGYKIVDHPDVVLDILDLTPGFIELGKDNYKTRREKFKLGDMVRLISEVWQ